MPGIAIGRINDSFSIGSIKAYLAEFISTLLFVFAGVGSAIAYGYLSPFLYLYIDFLFNYYCKSSMKNIT